MLIMSVARLFRVKFLVESALSAGCEGGVVFVSCGFEECSVFFEALDHSSLDETSVSVPILSAFFSVMPLSCLGFVFPPVLFPVCGFALCLFSAASAYFLSCCSFRDIFR